MSWQDDEAAMLSGLTLSVELPALLCQSYSILHDLSTSGLFAIATVHHLATLVATKVIFLRLADIAPPRRKFWGLFALIQIFQLLIILAEIYSDENDFVASCLVSTIAMMAGEVSPVHSEWVNGALFAKHLAVWVALGRRRMEVGQIGVLPVVWAFYLILTTQFMRRKMLIAKLKAEQSTQINEQRLNAILQSIPDGIVVLTESLEVLAYNQTLLKQLSISSEIHPEAQISTSIENLRYDPDYITETDTEIAEDIKKFTNEAVETVTDFKPVRMNGIDLECRGCISQWDEAKVCVLTIRDTSNWVALEKKAKLDSANKTSLLRSVSHELRTPTNAILNLALDIKSTETLTAQGVHDVEILISATKFLMSIINDLLDFSRILHDSFTLARHAFKLEPVIRECAQMIEPQCREKKLDFRVRYDALLPELAYTDENRLKQVILNLLSNAAK